MRKIIDKIKEWVKENWDDIRILLLIGIPSGLLGIVLFRWIDFARLF